MAEHPCNSVCTRPSRLVIRTRHGYLAQVTTPQPRAGCLAKRSPGREAHQPMKQPNLQITMFRLRRAMAPLALLAALAAAPAVAGQSQATLESGISSSTAKEGALSAAIQTDSHKIDGFQGSIDDLQGRLSALESSLAVEHEVLERLRSQLKAASRAQTSTAFSPASRRSSEPSCLRTLHSNR